MDDFQRQHNPSAKETSSGSSAFPEAEQEWWLLQFWSSFCFRRVGLRLWNGRRALHLHAVSTEPGTASAQRATPRVARQLHLGLGREGRWRAARGRGRPRQPIVVAVFQSLRRGDWVTEKVGFPTGDKGLPDSILSSSSAANASEESVSVPVAERRAPGGRDWAPALLATVRASS